MGRNKRRQKLSTPSESQLSGYTEVECYKIEPSRSSTEESGLTPASVTPTDSRSDVDLADGMDEPSALGSSVPQPGKTYKIHNRDYEKHITLVEGEIRLLRTQSSQPDGGCYWSCVEKNGWLGFRNSVSGTYLGGDACGGFHAKVTHHKAHEYFCVRHSAQGGYNILVKHFKGDELWKMGCSDDGCTLVELKWNEESDLGLEWEFKEV